MARPDHLGLMTRCCAGSQAAQPQWQESTEAIDKSLLMARDPILFYDEVPLYESELDDNGVASLNVKVSSDGSVRSWWVGRHGVWRRKTGLIRDGHTISDLGIKRRCAGVGLGIACSMRPASHDGCHGSVNACGSWACAAGLA